MSNSLGEMWKSIADGLANEGAARRIVIECDVSAGYVDVEVVCAGSRSVSGSASLDVDDIASGEDEVLAEEGESVLDEMSLRVLASARDPRLKRALKCPIEWVKTFDGHL